MSGSSLDGLDIVYTHLEETGGKWNYEIIASACYSYSPTWIKELTHAINYSALKYQLLHTAYGRYIGQQVNHFIDANHLQHKVDLVASHGHTVFHLPDERMTAQLGDGAAIAAEIHLPVVSDLRSMDVALGGQGAPIVPIGEMLLFKDFDCFLNIGGIANISMIKDNKRIAFDVCPANRVLNMLSQELNMPFDEGGKLAASGNLNNDLLTELNSLEYYGKGYPKSLDNQFGTDVIFPLIKKKNISIKDALNTYTEHICMQVKNAVGNTQKKMLITGGGAFNIYLIERLKTHINSVEIIIPDTGIVQYKEALIMALMGALRWREEMNVLASVTGASQNSIGGTLWLGTSV